MDDMSDQHVDPEALKIIGIANAKALLEENGMFVVPMKRKQKEADKGEIRSVTSGTSNKSKGNKSSGCPHCQESYQIIEKIGGGKHTKVKCCHCDLISKSNNIIRHIKEGRCPGLK